MLDDVLKGIGDLLKFGKKCPDKCRFLIDKVLRFHEKRYNVLATPSLYGLGLLSSYLSLS